MSIWKCQWNEIYFPHTFTYTQIIQHTRFFRGFFITLPCHNITGMQKFSHPRNSKVAPFHLKFSPKLYMLLSGAFVFALHWRHNDHDGVSNHQPHGCLLNRLFRRRSKKTSKLCVTGLCVGNSPGPVNSPHKGPVTRKMFPFDDVIMVLAVIRAISIVIIIIQAIVAQSTSNILYEIFPFLNNIPHGFFWIKIFIIF